MGWTPWYYSSIILESQQYSACIPSISLVPPTSFHHIWWGFSVQNSSQLITHQYIHSMPKQLTKQQIEDYLIHHIKLERSIPSDFDLARESGWYDYNPDTMPFKVQWYFSTIRVHFIAVAKTPWKCYKELAKMIWEDMRANKIITRFYNQAHTSWIPLFHLKYSTTQMSLPYIPPIPVVR